MVRQRYNDIISQDQIKYWLNNNSKVLLDGGTGTGKSYFINNKLAEVCSKQGKHDILYLCNRSKLKAQQLQIIYGGYNNVKITVLTYQAVEQSEKDDLRIDIECGVFDIIVCDEAHYFITDSWNGNTDIMFDVLKDADTPVIYLTATPQYILPLIRFDERITIPQDFSYIDLVPYSKKEDTETILCDLLQKTDDKIVCFCGSKTTAKQMYYKYSDIYGKDLIKIVASRYQDDAELTAINSIDEDFIIDDILQPRLLITTSVLDNGINICDPDLKHMIIDLLDNVTIHQCIGRKRIVNDNDKLTVYLKDTQSGIQDFMLKNEQRLLSAKTKLYKCYLKQHIEYLKAARKNGVCKIFYDYIKQSNIVLKDNYSTFINDNRITEVLDDYFILYSYIGDAEREQFINDLNIKKDYKLVKSVSGINAYISKYGYIINTKRIRIEGKQETIWILDLM